VHKYLTIVTEKRIEELISLPKLQSYKSSYGQGGFQRPNQGRKTEGDRGNEQQLL
jgi:hypothetical protein